MLRDSNNSNNIITSSTSLSYSITLVKLRNFINEIYIYECDDIDLFSHRHHDVDVHVYDEKIERKTHNILLFVSKLIRLVTVTGFDAMISFSNFFYVYRLMEGC